MATNVAIGKNTEPGFSPTNIVALFMIPTAIFILFLKTIIKIIAIKAARKQQIATPRSIPFDSFYEFIAVVASSLVNFPYFKAFMSTPYDLARKNTPITTKQTTIKTINSQIITPEKYLIKTMKINPSTRAIPAHAKDISHVLLRSSAIVESLSIYKLPAISS